MSSKGAVMKAPTESACKILHFQLGITSALYQAILDLHSKVPNGT